MHASYDFGYDTRSSSYSTSVMTAPLLGTSATLPCNGGAALLQPLRAAPIRCRVKRDAAASAAAVASAAGPPSHVYAIDHLSTKLRVPMSAVVPTQAMEDDGLVPGLCRLFLEGRCRQGEKCFQVHADAAVVQQLRMDALQTPSCCHVHGAPCNYEGFPLGLTLTLEGARGGGGSNSMGERADTTHASSSSMGACSRNSSFVCTSCNGHGNMYSGTATADGAAAAAAGVERASIGVMASSFPSAGDVVVHANSSTSGGNGGGAAAAAMHSSMSSSSFTGQQPASSHQHTPARHVVPSLACNGNGAQQPPASVVVALSSLCPTSYLWNLYKDSGGAMHLRAPVSRVCREHRKGLCRFGDECNFLHICRDTAIGHLIDHHTHHGHRHHHSNNNNNGSSSSHHSHLAASGAGASRSCHSYGAAASYQHGATSWSASLTEMQQQQQQQQQQHAQVTMAGASGTASGHHQHYSSGTHAGAAALAFADSVQAQSMGGGGGNNNNAATASGQRQRAAHGLVGTSSTPYGTGNSYAAGACSFMGNSASSSFAGVRSTLMASVRSFGNLAEEGNGGGGRIAGPAPLLRPLSNQPSHCTNPPTRQNSFCNNPYADVSSLQ